MKTIGLLGGMSWESTVSYYQLLNRYVNEKLGGLHSAKILLYSVDFAELEACLAQGEWERIADILAEAALKLEKAGADFLAICTNTMHKVVPQIREKTNLPLIHIAEAAADALLSQGIKKAGLLGTAYTMEQEFYRQVLEEKGLEIVIPEAEERLEINRIIFSELCRGIISPYSKKKYLEIIAELNKNGAEGIILGCTEIGLLIKPEDTKVPLFDTTEIHARAIAEYALGKMK